VGVVLLFPLHRLKSYRNTCSALLSLSGVTASSPTWEQDLDSKDANLNDSLGFPISNPICAAPNFNECQVLVKHLQLAHEICHIRGLLNASDPRIRKREIFTEGSLIDQDAATQRTYDEIGGVFRFSNPKICHPITLRKISLYCVSVPIVSFSEK
jgi:hypothetical protein